MKRNEFEHTLDILHESLPGTTEALLAYYQVLAEYDNLTGDVLNLVRLLSEVVSAKDENKEGTAAGQAEESKGQGREEAG